MSELPDINHERTVVRRRFRRLIASMAVIFLITAAYKFLSSFILTRAPRIQVIGAFDGRRASFSFAVTDEPPFHLLIALPAGVTVPADWSGAVNISVPDGSQWNTDCSAATMEPCDWCGEDSAFACFILARKSTPRLSGFLKPRETVTLTITGSRPFSSPANILLSGIKDSRE